MCVRNGLQGTVAKEVKASVCVCVYMWFRKHAGQIHHSHGRIVVCFLFGSNRQCSFHQSCLKNTGFRLKYKISKPCVCERDLKPPYMLTSSRAVTETGLNLSVNTFKVFTESHNWMLMIWAWRPAQQPKYWLKYLST